MTVEIDAAKNAKNIAKHGVPLIMGTRMDIASALCDHDMRKDYREIRVEAIGYFGKRLYTMVFNPKDNGNTTRIVSLRKANSREVRRYEKAKKT